MITRMTGRLSELGDERAALEIDAFEYEVLVPAFVRRQLNGKLGEVVSLRTIEYLDGNPNQGRLTPRIVGFTSDAEREFFELICSVDGVGVKKALRAMVRPVHEVAAAIEEADVKQLSTLPGVGPAVAERIIAKLRRKIVKYALMVASDQPSAGTQAVDLLHDAYEALLSVGHSPQDARNRIEAVRETGAKFKTVEDILSAVYAQAQN